jgi:hypothetical protein
MSTTVHPADGVIFSEFMETQTKNAVLQVVRLNSVQFLSNTYSAPEHDTIRVWVNNTGTGTSVLTDLTLEQAQKLISMLQAALEARRT